MDVTGVIGTSIVVGTLLAIFGFLVWGLIRRPSVVRGKWTETTPVRRHQERDYPRRSDLEH